MGQSCVEYITAKDLDDMLNYRYEDKVLNTAVAMFGQQLVKAVEAKLEAERSKHDHRERGETGEEITAVLIAETRGYERCLFDRHPSGHGIDVIAKTTTPNGQVRFLIVESKDRLEQFTRSIAKGRTKDGNQMSTSWFNERIEAMQDPKTPYYTARNAELAAEVAKIWHTNPGAIERVGYHLRPLNESRTEYQLCTYVAELKDAQTDVWHMTDPATGERIDTSEG